MPTPRTPAPRYINFDIVKPYLDQQINITTDDPLPPGYISQDTVNQQIAMSESDVELDLGTYYATPFTTLDGGDWMELSDPTYDYLYKVFIARSVYNIYRIYYGTTGENKGDDFWTSMLSNYNELLKRFFKLDQTINYLYPAFQDLKLNPIGMKRILKPSKQGILGGCVAGTWNALYALRNTNKPYLNWG